MAGSGAEEREAMLQPQADAEARRSKPAGERRDLVPPVAGEWARTKPEGVRRDLGQAPRSYPEMAGAPPKQIPVMQRPAQFPSPSDTAPMLPVDTRPPLAQPATSCQACCCWILCVSFLIELLLGGWYLYEHRPPHCELWNPSSLVADLPAGRNGNDLFLLNSSMPEPLPRDAWARLSTSLQDIFQDAPGYIYGYANASAAPGLMYNGTSVPGVVERVPRKLRGVFWMRGNPLPEVLVTMQYARWHEDEEALLFYEVPFSWSWLGTDDGRSAAKRWTKNASAVSLRFQPCPSSGVRCKAGTSNLTYGRMQMHPEGDLKRVDMDGYFWDIEELPSEAGGPGSLWYRRVGLYCVHIGGYQLTKILDDRGRRIDPYFSDYLSFMGDRRMIIQYSYGRQY